MKNRAKIPTEIDFVRLLINLTLVRYEMLEPKSESEMLKEDNRDKLEVFFNCRFKHLANLNPGIGIVLTNEFTKLCCNLTLAVRNQSIEKELSSKGVKTNRIEELKRRIPVQTEKNVFTLKTSMDTIIHYIEFLDRHLTKFLMWLNLNKQHDLVRLYEANAMKCTFLRVYEVYRCSDSNMQSKIDLCSETDNYEDFFRQIIHLENKSDMQDELIDNDPSVEHSNKMRTGRTVSEETIEAFQLVQAKLLSPEIVKLKKSKREIEACRRVAKENRLLDRRDNRLTGDNLYKNWRKKYPVKNRYSQ